jgi:hypothetical protein
VCHPRGDLGLDEIMAGFITRLRKSKLVRGFLGGGADVCRWFYKCLRFPFGCHVFRPPGAWWRVSLALLVLPPCRPAALARKARRLRNLKATLGSLLGINASVLGPSHNIGPPSFVFLGLGQFDSQTNGRTDRRPQLELCLSGMRPSYTLSLVQNVFSGAGQ